ncbi:MAG: SpoIIE family protein phosphatase [Gracilibacteraceae bacterium]|jgi:serine/threonine protein phosphatase PrpC|nr:SpoIIE family protein phosphatase [Gracilibacteraceae bacterium]
MSYFVTLSVLFAVLAVCRLSLGKAGGGERLEIAVRQSIGGRQINADVYDWAAHQEDRLLVVADGIGREANGRLAAKTAAASVTRYYSLAGYAQTPVLFFCQAFAQANQAVLTRIPDESAGTSLLAVLVKNGEAFYALAGECRFSVLRNNELITLTDGQTLAVLAENAFRENKVERAEARAAYLNNRVYNYIGREDFRGAELAESPQRLQKGDILIIMTDGIYTNCPEREFIGILRQKGRLGNMASKIIRGVENQRRPEQDNATIVLIRVNI